MKRLITHMLLWMILISACSSDVPRRRELSSETVTVNAKALSQAYADNIDRADRAYKGKTLLLTGSVSSILKERPGWINVYFSTGTLSSDVLCIFANDQSKAVGELKEGKEVTVKGYCEGRKDYIQLSSCIVVTN